MFQEHGEVQVSVDNPITTAVLKRVLTKNPILQQGGLYHELIAFPRESAFHRLTNRNVAIVKMLDLGPDRVERCLHGTCTPFCDVRGFEKILEST